MTDVRHGVTVIILTRNEKNNIEACIETARFADEIIVIDSGSEDNTMELAEKAGAKVYLHPFESFAGQRNYALEVAETDWIFYLDADERITKEAAQSILAAVERNEKCFYELKRINYVFGIKQEHGVCRPDYSERLYLKDSVVWEGIVHENAVVSLPKKRLDGVLEHYTYVSWEKYFVKFNQYTTLMADKMHEKGKRTNLLDLTIRPLFAFFRAYIILQGFRDGFLGFVMSVVHAQYTFIKYVKLYYKDGVK